MAGGGRGYFAGIEIEEEFLGSPKALLGMTRRQKNEILRVRHVLGPHECVKFFPERWPSCTHASRRLRFSWCAFLAMAAALS